MKKILLITFEYPAGRTYCGGVGQIVKQCRQVLLDLGHETHVMISADFQKKRPVKLLLPDGTLKRYAAFGAFRAECRWDEFDYIIQHFVNWTGELKRIRDRRGKRPGLIYHFHSILRRERDSGFKTLNRFLLKQEKMIEIADKIICPSRYEYDNFIRYFPSFREKVILIENTVETFPRRPAVLADIRRRHGISKDDIVSIYVGRLEKIKGADMLIRHLPDLLKRHKKLKVFVIGRTIERDLRTQLTRVQKRFGRRLFYIKWMEKDQLFQYYYMSTIYINTSLSESFSLATHEGALCDNALLLNDLPVFDKFKDAALFFSDREERHTDFRARYEDLIEDGRLRSRLAGKAAAITKDFLSKNRLKEDLTELLKAV